MTPELDSCLQKLYADVCADTSRLPVLFWLRAYSTLAMERQTPRIRWAKLSGFVSRTAREFGIDGLNHAPGHAIVTDYDLFQAVPIDGVGVVRDHDSLLNLDWKSGYDVELLDEYQPALADVARWATETWEALRRGDSGDGALVSILTRWAPEGRSGLLPALIEAQEAAGGWIRPATLAQIAQGLGIPLSEAYGTATYYRMIYTRPVGRKIIRVCNDVRCYLAGSEKIISTIEHELGVHEGETTADGGFTFELAPCMGHCDCAPVLESGSAVHERVDLGNVMQVLDAPEIEPQGIASGPVLLKDIANPLLGTLDGYISTGGFAGLRRALFEMTPDQVISEVKGSGLVGRGGAAFPTGMKWELTRKAIMRAAERAADETERSTPRRRSPGYLVCNADESETGTFKDRILLERNPFRILEGILIAARAIGASFGYIYIRGEYPLAYRRFRAAIEEARAKNYLGSNILDSDWSFDLEIWRGAGSYECGEETALFESIEGKRGEPRVKPPFPVDVGLFGKPTTINNAETLANVPFIISHGAKAYRELGTEKSPGTRLVCLSGQVERGGLYEIPMGTTLRHVIYDLGGGLHKGATLKAVLVGGAAGTFLSPDQIEVPLAFESLSAIGATFGSGAIIVFDDSADMWGVLKRIARFFKEESCGKCFPCQLGTQRQLEMVNRMSEGRGRLDDRHLLFEVGQVMKDASLCGLGQFASTAILSAFDKGMVAA